MPVNYISANAQQLGDVFTEYLVAKLDQISIDVTGNPATLQFDAAIPDPTNPTPDINIPAGEGLSLDKLAGSGIERFRLKNQNNAATAVVDIIAIGKEL